MRLLILLLTALALTLAPTGAPAWAIAHGQDAPAGAYPFTVRLTMTGIPAPDGPRDSWCTGALVAPRWVLTAGHCFRDAADRRVSRPVARRTTATVGRTDLSGPGGHELDVIAVRQSDSADVALAELAEPVTDVAPLPVAATPPAPGETVRLTGYGQTGADSGAPARLQTGEFVVGRVGEATVEVAGRRPRADTSACPHDSGGPYFRESPPALVGVVSNGPTCPHEGADVSARTDNLAGWITDTTTAPPGGRLRTVMALLSIFAAAVLVVLATIRYRTRSARIAGRSRHRARVRAGVDARGGARGGRRGRGAGSGPR